ncbi:MAG: GH3 auxin-responsive promoter family protein [Alphaproteobacteria bacterium]
MPSLSNMVRHAVLRTALRATQGRFHGRLLEASKTPRDTQVALLRHILAMNAGTEFGRRHELSRVKSIDDYRTALPIQTYEDLRPFIERQELTGEECLTMERPVYYHRTIGTVGAPKNIPITKTGLKRIRRQQKISAYAQFRGSAIFDGKMFGITGQAVEGRMAGGTPFGSASGLLYQSQSTFVRSRYVLPPEIFALADYEARYLAMAIYGLSEPRVTCIATANPSTLVRILAVINQNPDAILDAVATGRLPDSVSPTGALKSNLAANPNRAARLADKLAAAGTLDYFDIWPNLKGVVTWTGGSCEVPLRRLSSSLTANSMIIELGYVASEFRGTINIDVQRNICLPTLSDTFFEFAERQAWDDGKLEFLSLHELDVGRDYYVFVTTTDGLYRYDMNDIVRVAGRVNNTPTLTFVQKGKGVTNITGEKLYESQVVEAVLAALSTRRINADFFIMLADQETAGYTLYIEASTPIHGAGRVLFDDIDGRLRLSNIEYDGKRGSGRLAPLEVRWLQSGTGEIYRQRRVAGGQRDAQFKYLHLQLAHECAFDLDAHGEPG